MRVVKKIGITIFTLLLCMVGITSYAQPNSTCANASPFCTGQVMNFPAATNTTPAQPGPNYGCLGSQPNPTWFYMQIQTGGPFVVAMSANFDIDFICWGPFPNLASACGSLVVGNTQDCSYSGSPTETCTIANAIPGQFYLLLITNFSNQVQNITFTQTNTNTPGFATTNCGMICIVSPTNSGIICAGGNATVNLGPATSSGVTTYTWTSPLGVVSNQSIFTAINLQSTTVYTVRGSTNANTCQATTTVNVVQYPNFTVNPNTFTICQGGTFGPSVSLPFGIAPASFNYFWTPLAGSGVLSAPFSQSTAITPNLAPVNVTLSTVVYSITVSPKTLNCPVTTTLAVTINNPLTPTLTMPQPVCNTFNPQQLIASPGGGTWTTNNAINAGGMLNPALATIGTNSVVYSVTVGNCTVSNSGTFSVSKFYTAALTSSLNTLCVQDPTVNLMTLVQSTVNGRWFGPNVASDSITFNPSGLPTGNYNLTYTTFSSPISSVCPSSTILTVFVFNPPVPTFSLITPKCNTSPTVMLSANPPGGVWSQNAGVSQNGLQTPSLNTIGTNSVVYTAGLGTCVAASTATFHVSKFNPATLIGTVPNLCYNSNPFNLMTIVQNTNGSWSGVNVSLNTFSPGALPTNNYSLVYNTISVPDPLLCPDSKTIIVNVLNPPTPNITQVGPFCSIDAPVQLVVSPNTGTWSAQSYLTINGAFIPSLSAIGNNAVQYATGNNTCFVQQTKIINVEAFVPSTILNNIPDLCNTSSPFNLQPITVNNSGVWSGIGVSGSNFLPSLSGAGNYILTYKTASSPSGLCPSQSTVAVNVFSLATPQLVYTSTLCNNTSAFQIQVNPVGGIFGGVNNHAVTSSGVFNPGLASIGNNMVNYSVSAGPCIAYAQATINVEKFVSADFERYLDPLCKNNFPVNLNSLVKNPGGSWKGTGITGSIFYPSKALIGNNNFIEYHTSSQPNNLCPDSSAIRIEIMDIPKVNVTVDVKSGCAPFEAKLSASDINSGQGVWNIGDGSGFSSGLTHFHLFNTPGTYTVLFFYTNQAGCTVQDTLNEPIIVYESPKADFIIEPAELYISNPEASLVNLSTNLRQNKYQWNIQGMPPLYDINENISFSRAGTFKITLTAVTLNGCKDEVTRLAEVKNDFNVFIPNSFSPNADGVNDVFIPVFSPFGLDLKGFEMEIFDRWGHLMYSTRDILKGWDGTLNNGGDTTPKQDSYTYKIKYKDLDGRVYLKTGYLVLLGN